MSDEYFANGEGDEALCWKTLSEKILLHHSVMDVVEKEKQAESGMTGQYVSVRTFNWVIAIPVHDGRFVMVRQWRHGLEGITTEFPGGVQEDGETPELTATDELHTDDDEFIEPVEIPVEEVIERFGSGEFCNVFVGTGLALYLKHIGVRGRAE